ncbi:MAG: nucleotidyltransferase domain-containing protein [Candidatus Woesearchaeota archaeon]
MRTLIKETYWDIINIFYNNKNTPVHLREISRMINLKEGPLSRHLNRLIKEKILVSHNEGNLKKFKIPKTKIPEIFTIFDIERYQNIPYIRKNAISFFIRQLKEKPLCILLFGSTAKNTSKKDSDIDLITIFNKKIDTKNALKYAEAQTGIKISEFQMTYQEFTKELKLKEDNVIQAGIETGFPICNHLYYYEEINNG